MADTAGLSRAESLRGGRSRIGDLAPTYGALAALVLLIVFNSIFTANFLDFNNFRNILLQVAPTMLVATGMTMVIATGGIDLSVGSVMAIASAGAAPPPPPGGGVAILLALLIAGRGIALVFSSGNLVEFHNDSFQWLGTGLVAGVPVQVILMALVVAVAVFLMRATT